MRSRLGLWFQVDVAVSAASRGIAMMMLAPRIDLDIDHVELAVTHAAFGDQRIRKTAHGSGRPAQDHAFKTIFVIEMGVQRGHRQVVLPCCKAVSRSARSRS